MKTTTLSVCAALLLFTVALAQPYTGSVEMEKVEQDWFTEATMSMEQAISAAEDAVEVELAFLAASLEIRYGYLVYEVSAVDEENQNHMFTVDAGDGSILAGLAEETAEEEEQVEETEEEEAVEPEEPATEEPAAEARSEEEVKLHPAFELDTDMVDAIEAAEDEFAGYALKCRLAQRGETWVYSVLIADKDIETATIQIDASTGEVYEP